MIRSIVFCLFVFVFISCTTTGKKTFADEVESGDSIIAKFYYDQPELKDIYKDSMAIYAENRAKYFENKSQFDPIRNGFDSFQLRISYAYPLESNDGDSIKTLIIKRENQKWSGEVRKITPLRSNDSLFYVVTLQRQKIVPLSGWDSFITQLFNFKLLNKSFYTLDEENAVVHEPTSILFQIANSKEFKEYRYLVPSFYEKKYWQIEELSKIIKLLETEVQFRIFSKQ